MQDSTGWTKEKELAIINQKQADYVSQLIKILNSPESNIIKTINFNSPTGTGKTNMMALLFNQMPDYFFIVTTLSRGQLNKQVDTKIRQWAKFDNFLVYGLQDYTTATIRTADDIIAQLPKDKPIIWVRDEGHINTNRWQEILQTRCKNIINFSATNKIKNGIFCNFTETAMLRTPKQQDSSNPEDALKKLIEVKQQHKQVKNYNPCAIFRLFDEKVVNEVIKLCQKYKLKYINITDEEFIMAERCEDDNEYDVIINKLKIVEGIDIRRAHVLYMDNRPGNLATTVQMIGRCRRNALLWRDDIDIFAPENKQLLIDTRQCFIFYRIDEMSINEKDGELLYELCDTISVEELTVGARIHVDNGVMPNGLSILELANKTGDYEIKKDEATGFNYVDNPDFYRDEILEQKFDTIILSNGKQVSISEIKKNWKYFKYARIGYHHGGYRELDTKNKKKYTGCEISAEALSQESSTLIFKGCLKKVNSREIAIIGADKMKFISGGWIEDATITSKLSTYSKLNRFISEIYSKQIKMAKNLFFNGNNEFGFSKKYNSCLGYCVEYYAKYILYGEYFLMGHSVCSSLSNFFRHNRDLKNLGKDLIIIKSCMFYYRQQMKISFGINNAVIPTISVKGLLTDEGKNFIKTVIELGKKTAGFLRQELNITKQLELKWNKELDENEKIPSPNLSVNHIRALCDFISKDKIIDIKVTNSITEKHIKQVLTYHWLSKFRDDVDIHEVIVYDAVSRKSVKIHLD